MTVRIDRVRTRGVFSLDGQDVDVENNVWVVGDDERVVVVDAAHDVGTIADAVDGRRALMIVATHGHNDHINAAVDLARRLDAPVALHPDDRMLWDTVHAERAPDLALTEGQLIEFAGTHVEVRHTPGHSPGGVCLYLESQGVV
ncbi:MAG TPA: MBL fold metallo-hydrolase, partial [Acidimicrobiales bacterium]|nr:MBL fold metallo-hydrolase [Acidimicrobiales bacterium]